MVKHNNVVPNQHFRKYWAQYVRTWFDQPASKSRRRNARTARAKKLAPRPLHKLHPVVRCPTLKYNTRARAGRGFTIDELRAAGVNRKEAIGVGISVDWRRKNRNMEAFTQNVNRLKLYKSKLVVFPRNPTSKHPKTGDATKEDRKKAKQVVGDVLPIRQPVVRAKARKITKEEREATVVRNLRKALTDQKRAGARAKRQKEKEVAAAAGAKKAAKAEAGDGGAGAEE